MLTRPGAPTRRREDPRRGSSAGPSGVDPRRSSDRGSALVLMPALLGVVLILAALAVDLAVVWRTEAELADAAAAAANDLATIGLDEARFRADGRYALRGDLGRAAVAVVAARGDHLAAHLDGPVRVEGRRVTVCLRAVPPRIFSAPVGGWRTTVRRCATAEAVERLPG